MVSASSGGSDRPTNSRPLAWLATPALVFLAWLWLWSGHIRQWQVMLTYACALLFSSAALGWWVFFSGRKGRKRWLPVLVLAAIAFLFFTLVRVRGVTGDWYLVMEWRLANRDDWGTGSTQTAPPGSTGEPLVIETTDSFPRFLGANGDSIIRGARLEPNWEAHPPRLMWKRKVGAGWSGFSIADEIAITMEQRGEEEVIVAYELATGTELWTHADTAYFANPVAGPGPRATPTLSPTRVFCYGASGLLKALDPRSGRLLWQHDVVREHAVDIPEHGKTSSPLLVGDLVVISAGGPNGHSLVAFDQETGELEWHGGSDQSGYSSPTLATLAGRRQILIFNQATVAAHAPEDGRVLWQHPWPKDFPNASSPVVVDDERVLFSTGYGIGSKMLRVTSTGDDFEVTLLWESPRLKAKFTNLVIHQGSIYGLDDGVLICLDPETGERRWKRGRYGHGNILLVGNLLLVQTEKGEMVMISPNPEEHEELGRFTALRGKAWNPFAIAGHVLLVRNDREAAAWELPLEAATALLGDTQDRSRIR